MGIPLKSRRANPRFFAYRINLFLMRGIICSFSSLVPTALSLKVDGTTFELGDIQKWLCRALNAPMPSVVDSAGVAGVMDMLRSQGSWFHSVRLAFHLGGGVPHLPMCEGGDTPPPTLNYPMPDEREIAALAQTVEVPMSPALG